MPRSLVVCDVCDTLFDSNTTFDFIWFHVRNSWRDKFMFGMVVNKWSPFFWATAVVGKILRKDIARNFILRFLAGKSLELIHRDAEAFYDHFLVHRINQHVLAILSEKANRAEIWLLSSSIDPVVEVIAKRNRFRFKSSILGVSNGRYTGRLEEDFTGIKHRFVDELMARENIYLTVITDNRTDRCLVELAHERFIVIKADREKKFWRDVAPRYINLADTSLR